LMRIELGVPDRTSERAMLLGMDRRVMLKELKPVMSPQTLIEIQDNVRKVHASPALLDYLQDLLDASRQRHFTGLSPRAGLALLHASQAWAVMHGREMLLPEDIQAVGVQSWPIVSDTISNSPGKADEHSLTICFTPYRSR